MGSVISVRVTDEERRELEDFSRLYNCGVSSMIKKLVFEKLEDDFDTQAIQSFERDVALGKEKTRPIDELWTVVSI